MSIFKAYDIRGIYGKELTEKTAEDIGRAYATFMNADEVVVGSDCRISSPSLTDSLIKGINGAGADVCNIDMVPAPALYFYMAVNKKQAGIYVTASHNPPEYNGFKLMNNVRSMNVEQIKTLEKMISGKNYRVGNGSAYKREIIGSYREYLKKKFKFSKMRVVIDSGNGTCGVIAPRIFKEMGCYATELYSEPNGRFPNHYPDPTRSENIVEIKRRVIEQGADFGIAFDGDGDRAIFIDEKGNDLKGDQALMLFAREILAKQKGKVIFTVSCSKAVEEDVKAHGGIPVLNVVGHSFLKERLFQENALIAGEISGHLFFNDDYFGFDDGIYASMRMAQLIQDSGKKLSELVADLPKYHSSLEERIPCSDSKKFKIIEQLKKEFSQYKQITIDGVRIEFDGGWGLVRASNTEPVLSTRFEANTEQDMNRIKEMMMSALKKFGVL